MPSLSLQCRPVAASDWPGIMLIQSEAYHAIVPESERVMRSKAIRSEDTCLVIADHDEQVLAYCLAYPYLVAQVPALSTIIHEPMICPHHLFLHDLAVAKRATRRGLAKLLVNHLLHQAHQLGFESMSLVAIQQSSDFWSKQGFTVDASVSIDGSYPSDAVYMSRQVVSPQRLSNQACT